MIISFFTDKKIITAKLFLFFSTTILEICLQYEINNNIKLKTLNNFKWGFFADFFVKIGAKNCDGHGIKLITAENPVIMAHSRK
jgi:hypothetical protein